MKIRYLFRSVYGKDVDEIERKVRDHVPYLEECLATLSDHVDMKGGLFDMEKVHPSRLALAKMVYADLSKTRGYLVDMVENRRNMVFNYIMYDDEGRAQYGNLKVTEAGKIASVDRHVIRLRDLTNYVEFYEKQFQSLSETIDKMGYTLRDIIDIHKEGMLNVVLS